MKNKFLSGLIVIAVLIAAVCFCSGCGEKSSSGTGSSNISSNNNDIKTQFSGAGRREYTPEQLRQMGLDYFKRHNDVDGVSYTPRSEVYKNADGTYTVRVYVWVYDGVTEHSSTCANYVVDSSGKGEETSYNGGYVDLTQ